LEHPWPPGRDAVRKAGSKFLDGGVHARVGAPAQIARAVEHLLGSHLHDRVGMRAYPRSRGCDLSKQRVERHAIEVAADRIDPDEHRIESGQVSGELAGCVFAVEHGLDREAGLGHRGEDRLESRVIAGRRHWRAGLATPKCGDSRLTTFHDAGPYTTATSS